MKSSKKALFWFILVMAIFLSGMIALLVFRVEDIWVWVVFIVLWSWVEMEVAKPLHFKRWVWILILALIIAVDLIVIWLVSVYG